MENLTTGVNKLSIEDPDSRHYFVYFVSMETATCPQKHIIKNLKARKLTYARDLMEMHNVHMDIHNIHLNHQHSYNLRLL